MKGTSPVSGYPSRVPSGLLRTFALAGLLLAGLGQAPAEAASFRPVAQRDYGDWSRSGVNAAFRPVRSPRRVGEFDARTFGRSAYGPAYARVDRDAPPISIRPMKAVAVFRGDGGGRYAERVDGRFRPDARAAASVPGQGADWREWRTAGRAEVASRVRGWDGYGGGRFRPVTRAKTPGWESSPVYRSLRDAGVAQQAAASDPWETPPFSGAYAYGW